MLLSISLVAAFAAVATTIPTRYGLGLCFKLFFSGNQVPKNLREEKERKFEEALNTLIWEERQSNQSEEKDWFNLVACIFFCFLSIIHTATHSLP